MEALYLIANWKRRGLFVENNKIYYLIIDVDGTLTDGKVFVSDRASGIVYRGYSTYDGHGFQIAHDHGRRTTLMSRSTDYGIVKRAIHLNADWSLGADDKERAMLEFIEHNHDARKERICYLGNDITDIPAMRLSGFVGCPSDAHPDVLYYVRYRNGFVSTRVGGDGVFRELVDWLVESEWKPQPFGPWININR